MPLRFRFCGFEFVFAGYLVTVGLGLWFCSLIPGYIVATCEQFQRMEHPMTGAWAFECEYSSTDSLLQRLNSLGGWQWRQGDSHWYGDYLGCVPFEGARIRICDFPEKSEQGYRYESDVRRASGCKTPLREIDEAFRKVLEQIPAVNITEIEGFD